MLSSPARVWLWQLSYAVLGLCFFMGLFMSIATWGTRGQIGSLAFAFGSLLLLALLNRVFNGRRPRPGACSKCGYATTGLPSGSPCPECGSPAGT